MKTAQTVAVFPDPPASMPAGLFSDFEITGRKRPGAFIASYGIQAIVVALLLTITLTTTAPVLIQKKYSAISLVAPTLSVLLQCGTRCPDICLAGIAVASRLVGYRGSDEYSGSAHPARRGTVDVPTPPAPKPVLQPSLLATVPAMPSREARPYRLLWRSQRRTGATADQRDKSQLRHWQSVGSFGTPATGTGRPSGRGVATGAFGTQSGASGQTNKAVKSVDFSEPALAKAQPVAAKVSPIAPVAIQSKPAPVYTEEARRLRVEGDVVVQVVFSATGEIRIVGVVKGLGHGLDEAAVAATRQIRFTPARRDGQFVDYPATIHVVFALS